MIGIVALLAVNAVGFKVMQWVEADHPKRDAAIEAGVVKVMSNPAVTSFLQGLDTRYDVEKQS